MKKPDTVYVGNAAREYEKVRAGQMWQREHDTIAPVLGRLLKPNERILDLAAGTGRWLEVYAKAGVRPVLLDISEDMLRIARERAQNLNCPVQIITGNISQMSDLPAADWLISTRFFNWIPLESIEHVLRLSLAAGIGQFAFSVRCLEEQARWDKRLRSQWSWGRKNLKVLLGVRSKGTYHLQSETKLRLLLSKLGLEEREQHLVERVRGEAYSLWVVERSQAPRSGRGASVKAVNR